MAKNNNLTDFLADVADAIREKKNKTGLINPQDFSSEIKSIETGSGVVESKEYKDVNFFDYEGTILYSYTWDEAKVMTELPPLPDRTSEGLVCQGWNYTLEDMMAQADENGENGYADIGAIYTTDDGSTRIHIELTEEDDLSFEFEIQSTMQVLWGDGTSETYTTSSRQFIRHDYNQKGIYVIRLAHVDSTRIFINSVHIKSKGKITNIHYGTNVKSDVNYSDCTRLMYLTYSQETQTHNNIQAAYKYTALRFICYPKGFSGTAHSMGNLVFNLEHVSLPRGRTEVAVMTYTTLKYLTLPSDTAEGTRFMNSNNIVKIRGWRPKNWQSSVYNSLASLEKEDRGGEESTFIETNCFNDNRKMEKIKIPKLVTEIRNQAFRECIRMKWYNFTDLTAIPTLASTNVFAAIPADCKIVVPDALVEDWRAATNWTTYVDYIIGKTEYLNSGGKL